VFPFVVTLLPGYFIFFFSFLAIGGEFVARDLGVPAFFVHVVEGLTLLFFAASEYLAKR